MVNTIEFDQVNQEKIGTIGPDDVLAGLSQSIISGQLFAVITAEGLLEKGRALNSR